jgi:hypothetical protein
MHDVTPEDAELRRARRSLGGASSSALTLQCGDWAWAGGLFVLFATLYLALSQPNLAYDGASFIVQVRDAPQTHRLHPGFGYYLHACLRVGVLFGLDSATAGVVQSALIGALALALLFALIRKLNVARPIAAVGVVLLGLNASFLEVGTTVELYAVSALTIVLSLWAWDLRLRRESLRTAAILFAAAVLVGAMHLAFSLWVAALYLGLAWWRWRRSRLLALRIVGEGFCVGLLLLVWLVVGCEWDGSDVSLTQRFFDMFWQPVGWGDALRRLI